jgi:tetratricopeptide (TPR) repeat protein
MLALKFMIFIVASTLVLLAATPEVPRSQSAPATSGSAASAEALRHYAQGRLLEERGASEAAIDEYYRALRADPGSSSIATRISEAAARAQDWDRSLEFANRALALEPANTRARWLEGVALFQKGQKEPALSALQAAAAADTENVEYLQALSHVAEEMDRQDVQEQAVRRLVQLRDDDAESWFQLASLTVLRQDFTTADHAVARVTELNPDRPGLEFLRGWVDEALGRDSLAVTAFRRHLTANPTDLGTRRRLVTLLARNERYAEAYAEARKVAAASPQDTDARFVEADLAFRSGDRSRGRTLLTALESEAGDDLAWLTRLVALEVLAKRNSTALALADRWAAAHPGDVNGQLLRARAACFSGDHAEGIARARLAVKMAPDSLTTHEFLGRLLQSEKRWAEAESVWTQAAARFSQNAGFRLQLSFCREQLGNLDGAQSVVRELLDREPDNAEALNSLGYMLADHNRDLAEAERLIRRAVTLEPDNGAFIDSLGWVLFRLGQLDGARTQLERAVVLTGRDPVVCEHLGDVYKELKFNELARQLYEQSLRRDAGNERVRSKLAQAR